ncbi:MAG: flagellar biosynthetic protein FliR [Ilumatobacteraceae bacterium]
MRVTADPALLGAFLLALVRCTAFLVACPFFNGPWVPFRVRLGFGMALALPLTIHFRDVPLPGSTAGWIVAFIVQAIAGIIVGLSLLIVFAGVQAAGELIDLQVGFSYSGTVDPVAGVTSTPVARIVQMTGTAVVFAAGGHLLVIRGFLRTVDAVPIGTIDIAAFGSRTLALASTVFIAAIEIALPVLAALFCAEIALGLLGKAAPQMNILVIGFAAKSAITIALLALVLAAQPGAITALIERGLRASFQAFGN